MLTRALATGNISALLARGIEPSHFVATADGQECAEVLEWATKHARRFKVAPSPALVKERWPNWHGEPTTDPLDAIVEAFVSDVKRRNFASKIRDLALAGDDPGLWHRLDEVLIDAGRDLAATISSARVSRLSEMEQRISAYELEKASGQPPGFQLGIPIFDDMIGGIRPGNVIVVSGYMGLGKSTLAAWMTLNVVEQGHSALFIPLEMSRLEVLERIDTMIVHFSHKLLRMRQLSEEDEQMWRRLAKQFTALEHDLVVLDGLGSFNIGRLWAEIDRHKPHFTVVDFVQLMKRSHSEMQGWESLVEITNECKAIALSTDSVIMLVSQDNRGAAETGSSLSTMGQSISVGQVADVYIGMHQTEDMRAAQRMSVKLLKVRNGPRDKVVDLLWDPSHMRFGEAEPGAAEFTRTDHVKA